MLPLAALVGAVEKVRVHSNCGALASPLRDQRLGYVRELAHELGKGH